MDFASLYGVELTRELGSADSTQLFTTARRKAAINAGQLEWLKKTECFQREVDVALVDGTREYDLETSISDYGWIAKQGVSIKIVSGSTTRYIEGDDLELTTVERLSREEPSWRGSSAGTPTRVYTRQTGGQVFLGFSTAPDISGSDTWTAVVSVVIIPSDMSADADEPFTYSSNVLKRLRPWHRALAHFGAYDLEKFRKDTVRAATQLKLFEREVEDYMNRQAPKGGQRIRLARDYRGSARHGEPRRYNPRAWP